MFGTKLFTISKIIVESSTFFSDIGIVTNLLVAGITLPFHKLQKRRARLIVSHVLGCNKYKQLQLVVVNDNSVYQFESNYKSLYKDKRSLNKS